MHSLRRPPTCRQQRSGPTLRNSVLLHCVHACCGDVPIVERSSWRACRGEKCPPHWRALLPNVAGIGEQCNIPTGDRRARETSNQQGSSGLADMRHPDARSANRELCMFELEIWRIYWNVNCRFQMCARRLPYSLGSKSLSPPARMHAASCLHSAACCSKHRGVFTCPGRCGMV
jgi:hypothetical protein